MSWTPVYRARTWLIALVTLAACTFTSVAAWADSPKIAVIDLTRAIADTEDGIRVKAELQELFDARQGDYETKEKALAESKADYDQLVAGGKTKQPVLRKKLVALEKMAYELQIAQQNYRREMQQKEYQLMQPIIKQMLALVRQLASKQGYEMVLNKEAVPFFRSDLDITDRVVQMYNASRAAPPATDAPKKAPAPKAAPKKPAAPKAKGGSKSSQSSKPAPKRTKKAPSPKTRHAKR